MTKITKAISALAALMALVSCSHGAALKCNYSEADITTSEDEHTTLAGFAARTKLSTTVHHRLYTHCLVLTDGEQKICMISNDLMEISPDLSLEIRKEIAAKAGIPLENIMMHCIHTHSAPRSGGNAAKPGGTNYTYKMRMMERVVENAVRTISDDSAFVPFRLETGKARTSINYNRCEAGGPVDGDVYVARFLTRSGKPIVSIINLACHPVCMGPSSYLVSSDYSGIAFDRLKEAWGGSVMQFTGAAGNMDPVGGPKDRVHAEQCGNSLADSLVNITFTRVKPQGKLRLTTNVASLPYRIEEVTPEAVKAHADSLAGASTDFPRFASDVRGWEKEILARFEKGPVKSKLDFNMEAVNVDGVIFFFSQGEPFCEYQQTARANFPESTVFFAGYTNGQNSYLPSKHAFEYRKGYEYEIEQMHVYIKAPYPLSPSMPKTYLDNVTRTITKAIYGEDTYGLVPEPLELMPSEGVFRFSRKTGISADPEFREVADDFKEKLLSASGISLRSGDAVTLSKDAGLEAEEYRIEIAEDSIRITAADASGAYYALQTICQLLPENIYSDGRTKGVRWEVPCCRIVDKPEFHYRGLHLDCGRYFYPKETVLKFLDLMAMHKLNMFHWHLTEDQGWRIEIKKYPRLTEVGAWRAETAGYADRGGVPDGTPHGGFYTQDEIREIVEYARHRQITVIPEVELPGHSGAAIAAYPELSCTPDEPKAVYTTFGVKKDVYCPNPFTIQFLEDVFTELFDLFPSPYYHFGGDECPKTAWENSDYCKQFAKDQGLESVDDIQDWFVAHFAKFLKDHGKTVIGWDEILDGPSASQAIALSYRGHRPASRAIRRGIRCILAPNRWSYLDNPQTELKNDGDYNIFMPLSKVYSYYPAVDSLRELSRQYIIGYEGCVWGEYIPTPERVDYMTWPRAAAIAEDCWCPRESKDFSWFCTRMLKDFRRLDEKDVNYCRSFWDVIYRYDNRNGYPRSVVMECNCPGTTIRYTLDGTEPSIESAPAESAISVNEGTEVRARAFDKYGNPIGETSIKTF